MAFFSNIVAFTKDRISNARSYLEGIFGGQIRHGVFDNLGVQNLFPDIGILNVEVIQDKTVASHPLEINRYSQDNIVTNPMTVVVTLAAEAAEVDSLYSTLNQLFLSSNTLVSVMTDNRLYKNLVIQALPIRRDPTKYDLLEVPVVFHEFIYSRVKVSAMSDVQNVELAEYSDRQKAGLQKTQTVSGADEIRIRAQKTVVPGQG